MNDIHAASVPASPEPVTITERPRPRRWPVFAAAAGVAAVGLALGWDWLVAVGIAPLLIAVGPCLAMCALGLCMHRSNRAGAATTAETPTNGVATTCCSAKNQDAGRTERPITGKE